MTTLLHDATEAKKYDSRMVDRNLVRGFMTQQDLDQHLKALPDDSQNADWVNIDTLSDDEEGSQSSSTH